MVLVSDNGPMLSWWPTCSTVGCCSLHDCWTTLEGCLQPQLLLRCNCLHQVLSQKTALTGSHCTVRLGHSSACVITRSAACEVHAEMQNFGREARGSEQTVEKGGVLLPYLVLLVHQTLLLLVGEGSSIFKE